MGEWLAFIGLSGIFLSGLAFLYNKGYQGANRFLAYFLFLGYLYIFIQFNTGYGSSSGLSAVLMSGFPSLYYLIGPCAYFYVRSILRDDVRLDRRDLLHLLPFFIVALGTIPFILTSWEHKLAVAARFHSEIWSWMDIQINVLMPDPVNQFLRAFHSLAYFGFTLWKIHVFFKAGSSQRSLTQMRLMRRWLYTLVGMALMINISYLVILFQLFHQDQQHSFLVRGAPSLTFIVMGAIAVEAVLLLFPQILYGIPTSPTTKEVNTPSLVTTNEFAPELLQQSGKWQTAQMLTPEYTKDIEGRLSQYIDEGCVLDAGCSVAHLSERTGLPQHHLHYYFNHVLGEKFLDWKSRLRIEWVTGQIKAYPDLPFTLDAIARQAGFEHRSTFVAAFRRVTGMLPRDFIKSTKSED